MYESWRKDKRNLYQVIKDFKEINKLDYGEIIEGMKGLVVTIYHELEKENE